MINASVNEKNVYFGRFSVD